MPVTFGICSVFLATPGGRFQRLQMQLPIRGMRFEISLYKRTKTPTLENNVTMPCFILIRRDLMVELAMTRQMDGYVSINGNITY